MPFGGSVLLPEDFVVYWKLETVNYPKNPTF